MYGWVEVIFYAAGGSSRTFVEHVATSVERTPGLVDLGGEALEAFDLSVASCVGAADSARKLVRALLRDVDRGKLDVQPDLACVVIPHGETTPDDGRELVRTIAAEVRHRLGWNVAIVDDLVREVDFRRVDAPEFGGESGARCLRLAVSGTRWVELSLRLRSVAARDAPRGRLQAVGVSCLAVAGDASRSAAELVVRAMGRQGERRVIEVVGQAVGDPDAELHGEVESCIFCGATSEAALTTLVAQSRLPISPPRHVLEHAIAASGESEFAARVASLVPAPGGGAVAARTGAHSVALTLKVLRLTLRGRKAADERTRYEELANRAEELLDRFAELERSDERGFLSLLTALRDRNEESPQRYRSRLEKHAVAAATPPLHTLRAARDLLAMVETLARHATGGGVSAESDIAVAAELAVATARSSVWNVRVNLPMIRDAAVRAGWVTECDQIESGVIRVRDQVAALLGNYLEEGTDSGDGETGG